MDKETRKQQILDSACSLFAAQSYDATSIAQIAQCCGCSSSLVMRHFGSKDNIYTALLERLETACRQPLVTEIPQGTPLEKLEALYHSLIFQVEAPENRQAELISALQSRGGTRELRAAALRHIQDVGMEIFLPILREGVEDGTFPKDFSCERAARILWLSINGSKSISRNYPKADIPSFSMLKEVLLGL